MFLATTGGARGSGADGRDGDSGRPAIGRAGGALHCRLPAHRRLQRGRLCADARRGRAAVRQQRYDYPLLPFQVIDRAQLRIAASNEGVYVPTPDEAAQLFGSNGASPMQCDSAVLSCTRQQQAAGMWRPRTTRLRSCLAATTRVIEFHESIQAHLRRQQQTNFEGIVGDWPQKHLLQLQLTLQATRLHGAFSGLAHDQDPTEMPPVRLPSTPSSTRSTGKRQQRRQMMRPNSTKRR